MIFIDIVGPDGARTIAIERAQLTIGSDAKNDVRIDHPRVASMHALVFERDGVVFLLAPGDRTTTTLDGEAISNVAPITERSRIGIGPFVLAFRRAEEPPADTIRMPEHAPPESELEPEPSAITVRPDSIEPPTLSRRGTPPSLRATQDPVELEFLRAIMEDEDHWAARAVYSDWLEERGELVYAEYTRLQIRLHPGIDPDAFEPARLRLLGGKLPTPWRALVAPRETRIERCPYETSQFPCVGTWGALVRMDAIDDVRICARCDRSVNYVPSAEFAREQVPIGEPVVVDPAARREEADLVVYRAYRDPMVIIGRRPTGLELVAPETRLADAAELFATSAALEAASVNAFETLASDLARLGAPAALRRRALVAACDETRHASAMATLAREEGRETITWAIALPTAPGPRSALEIARENAIEGCVREAYSARVEAHAADAAASARVRAVRREIAAEEETHAALAWDVARWLEPRLSAEERDTVDAARAWALADLERIAAREHPEEIVRVAGQPTAAEARVLVARTRDTTHAQKNW